MTNHPNRSQQLDWWTGSNGNLFVDYNGFRYCIAWLAKNDYSVARNGVEIARAQSVADAKLFVKREG